MFVTASDSSPDNWFWALAAFSFRMQDALVHKVADDRIHREWP